MFDKKYTTRMNYLAPIFWRITPGISLSPQDCSKSWCTSRTPVDRLCRHRSGKPHPAPETLPKSETYLIFTYQYMQRLLNDATVRAVQAYSTLAQYEKRGAYPDDNTD